MSGLDRSNFLTDLAARIRAEHKATVDALRSAVVHAMAAGDLLIEAKKQVPHGQWGNWFEENCAMSSRSGQLYMQLTKHREIIEKEQAKSAMGVADLTLSEAAALCVLAGRLERLMDFAKRAEGINGEDLIKLCIEQGFSVIKDEVARKKKNATGYCSECSSAICSFSTSNGCCSAVPTSKAASLQHFRILTGGLASWAASGASLIAGKTASRNSSKLGKPSALRTRTRPFQEVEVELLAAQKAAGIMGQPFG